MTPVGGGVVAVVRQEVADDSPVGGGVVAVVRQEVEVELVVEVQRDAAVVAADLAVHLVQQQLEWRHFEMLTQQSMSQAVDLDERIDFLV